MAYRAKTKAREKVMGGHKRQYHRIRDYLQTVIDKNLGSRCIVTTVTGPTEEEQKAIKKGSKCLSVTSLDFMAFSFVSMLQGLDFLKDAGPSLA